MNYVFGIQAAGILVALSCALSDIRERRIPNVACLLLALLGCVQSLVTGEWLDWKIALAALVVGLVLFIARCFGAGDIKFFWACVLFVPKHVHHLLVYTAASGLILAIVYLAMHRFRRKEVGMLPYGVAITAGFGLCLFGFVL